MGASETGVFRRRYLRFYLWLALFVAVGATASLVAGADLEAEDPVAGRYEPRPFNECLGRSFDLRQSGEFAWITNPGATVQASLRVREGTVTGTIECRDSSRRGLELRDVGSAIEGRLGTRPLKAVRTADVPPPEAQRPLRPADIDGVYELAPPSRCLGSEIELTSDDNRLLIDGAGIVGGRGRYDFGRLRGAARCQNGSRARLSGLASDREIQLRAVYLGSPAAVPPPERIEATEKREFSRSVAAFLLAVLVVMTVARLFGRLAVKARQPRVMGEVVAGIVLGPSVLGTLAPEVSATIFPSDLILALGVVANLGVVLFMFMVGAEVDVSQLRRRASQALAVSNGSVAIPMVLGMATAVVIYELVAPDTGFTAFALFMGVSMSITAFPVLARILGERGMLSRPIGVTALAAAAIDDVTAWFLIALASAFATAGPGDDILLRIGLGVAFCLVMFTIVRPALARAFATRGDQRRLPSSWLAAVLAGALLAAFVSEWIGIAVIFGAFLMGLIMPRDTELTGDAVRRIEDVVVLILLPLFFAYTGLRTNIGLLDSAELWLLTAGLLAVAIAGKFAGAMLGARVAGIDWRRSAVLGTLMNTRGLTELIALNIALDLGVISEALFTSLVIMALVTTFMAGPLLNLLEKRRTGEPMAEPAAAQRA